MVNLRLRPKANTIAPRATQKTEPVTTTLPVASDNQGLNETTLRRLPRADLQKLAKVHKIKANIKSELIIQQLVSLDTRKKTRRAEEDPEEGRSRKRYKSEAGEKEIASISVVKENPTLVDPRPATDTSSPRGAQDRHPPEAGPSVPRLTSPEHRQAVFTYDKSLFSSTESEMTEEEQLDFVTPVSSRSGTPPAANVIDLERCVTIMKEISEQDVNLLKEAATVRETAAKLRKRARDVRELIKAERGRRERMEAYFQYWQEMEPRWDRRWLHGESGHRVDPSGSEAPSGPPTIPVRQDTQEAQNLNDEQSAIPIPVRKQLLTPEEVKRRREAIIAKQELERRELEALQRTKVPPSRPSEVAGAIGKVPPHS